MLTKLIFIFRYGRTGLNTTGDQVHMSLSYSPKRETVEKKLKGLPIRWFRVFADTEEEFKVLCKGIQRFKEFTLALDEEHETSNTVSEIESSPQSTPPASKRMKKAHIIQNVVMVPPNNDHISDIPIEFEDENAQFV